MWCIRIFTVAAVQKVPTVLGPVLRSTQEPVRAMDVTLQYWFLPPAVHRAPAYGEGQLEKLQGVR